MAFPFERNRQVHLDQYRVWKAIYRHESKVVDAAEEVVVGIYLESTTGREFVVRFKTHGWPSEAYSAQHLFFTLKMPGQNPSVTKYANKLKEESGVPRADTLNMMSRFFAPDNGE